MRGALVFAHRWIGLALGLWLALIGLTGSILVFHLEIDEWLNAELFDAPPPGPDATFRPYGEIMAAAEAATPPGATISFGYFALHEGAAYRLFADVPTPSGGSDAWHLFVDPYSARLVGRKLIRSDGDLVPRSFIPFVFELHYALLLPWYVGGPFVGCLAVAFLVSTAAGLLLWWPSTGRWRNALAIKPRASGVRRVYDLHKVAGVYTVAVMLAVLISGVAFNLPETFLAVVKVFSPATVDRYRVQSEAVGTDRVSFADAMAIADQHTPDGRTDWLYPATEPAAAHTICKSGLEAISRFADRRCIVVDQWSGKILHVADAVSGTAGDTFLAWQWPLHSGQVFGWPGRIMVFLTGLACPVLFVTGLMRWGHKRRARALQARRATR